MRKMKSVLAVLLALAALLSVVPVGALAAEAEPVATEVTEEPAVVDVEPEAEPAAEATEPATEVTEPATEATEPAEEQTEEAYELAPQQEAVEESALQESAAVQETQETEENQPEPVAEVTEATAEEVLSVETETGSVKRLLGGASTKDAITVKVGEQVDNLFPVGSGDAKDYYKLVLASSGTLTISGSSKVSPIELELLDSKGNSITSFPNIDLTAQHTLDMTKGTYYLVFKKTGTDYGEYSFLLKLTAVPETVAESDNGSNNTKDKASQMSLNTALVGHFSITDDVDWYRFKLDKPGQIRFDAVANLSEISYAIVAENGGTVLSLTTTPDHITGENKVSNRQLDLLAGTYYLRIEAPTDTGRYTFQVRFTASNETYPDTVGSNKGTFNTARFVLANTAYNGQIAENGSADFYKFILSGDKDTVVLNAVTKMPKVTYRLYNGSKTLLKQVESSWKSASAAGTVNVSLPLAKGTYYLAVEGADGFTGAYSFQLKCKNQFSPVLRSATNEKGGVLLHWDNYGAARYRIFLKQSGKWTAVGNTTSTSFRYTKVASGKDYTFTIRAMDKAGKEYTSSYDSNGLTIRYIASPVLKSAVNQIDGVRIYWNASAGAAKYAAFYRVPKGKWTRIGTTTGTNLLFKNAKDGTAYEFTVRCLNASGSAYTSAYDTKGISATFLSAPKITSAVPESGGIRLTWSKSAGAVRSRVFYKASGKWAKLQDTDKTSILISTLVTGKSYTFTVRSIDKTGKTFTSGYDATGKSVTYLATPVLLDPTVSTNSATLKWKAVSGAASYRAFYKVKGAKSWTKVGDFTATSCTVSNLKSKQNYLFTVRCISADKKAYTSGYNTSGKAFKTK